MHGNAPSDPPPPPPPPPVYDVEFEFEVVNGLAGVPLWALAGLIAVADGGDDSGEDSDNDGGEENDGGDIIVNGGHGHGGLESLTVSEDEDGDDAGPPPMPHLAPLAPHQPPPAPIHLGQFFALLHVESDDDADDEFELDADADYEI